MSKRLIVLAAGWTGSKSSWYFMARRFKETGYDVVQAVYPYRGYTAIQYSSRAVGKLVETIRPEYDHCTFIGHSMGGLIGRHLVQRTEFGRYIDSYVSLGTPHYGTITAKFVPPIGGFGTSVRQMAQGSEFLQRLNSSEWPERIPALAVSAGMEEVVLPRSSAQFEHAENLTIPYTSHISLVIDPRTFWEVWAWLTFTVFGEGPLVDEGKASRVRLY